MKAYDFIQALNDVDEKYIREAMNYRASGRNMKIWRAVAIAACICLAATLGLTAASLSSRNSENAVSEDLVFEGGMRKDVDMGAENYAVMEEAAEEDLIDLDDYEVPFYAEAETAMDYSPTEAVWDGAAGLRTGAAEDMAGDLEDANQPGSKIIYNVYMSLETTQFDDTTALLEEVVSEFGGYLESQDISNRSRSYRNASYTIRIPAEELDAFLNQVGDLCTVTSMSRSAEDVSETYYDTASRLETARAKLERLQELLQEAEDMEDIITLESAISDVQWEIDNYGGSLRYYDSRVNYSTVTLSISEVYEVVAKEAPLTFGQKITQAFEGGIRGFGNFLKKVVIWLVNSWIWLIIIAVIVIAIILLIRLAARKRRARRGE